MSCGKRLLEGQDPDYENSAPHQVKRLRLLEESAKADLTQKVLSIIQREFSKEIAEKEREVFDIQERLHHAQKALHLLRYAVVKGYYTLKQLQGPSESDQTQKHIHPAVKKLIGKQPRHTLWQSLDQRSSKYRQATNDNYSKIASDNLSSFENANDTSQNQVDDRAAKVTKVPRYIPPRPSEHNIETQIGLSRNFRHKIKQRLILGNISKWIPIDSREDEASHKWMVYVRGPQELPDISPFVSKIRFFLHPSYKPHDVVEVTSHPFHLCRRGWGEFPVRIQVHFTHHLNKPVDLIHHLKLDRSYTGLQRLGAETVVDIWLHMGSSHLDTDSPLVEKSHPGEMIDTASPLFEKSRPGEMIDTASPLFEKSRPGEMIDTTSPHFEKSHTGEMIDTASPLFEKSHPGEMINTASPLFEKSHPGEMINTASPLFEKSHPGEMIDTASPLFEKSHPGEMIDTASPPFEKRHPGEMIDTASPLFEKSRPGEMTECCQDNSQQEAIQTDTPSTTSETVNIKLEVDCVDANNKTDNCYTGELHIKQELDQDLDTLRSEMIIHKISSSVTSFDHNYFQFANKQSGKENGKSIENSSWSNNACQNESLEYDPFVKHKNNCLGETSLESSKSEMLKASKNLCFHNENNIKNKSVESSRSFSCHSVHDFRNNVFNGFRTEEVIKKELNDVNSSDICMELSRDPLLPSTNVTQPLKKPTTLVKCMDASGNIFFIALGRLNAPSLKPINYLETKCESVTVPSFPRITTPPTVSSSDTIRPSLVFGEHSDCLENTALVQTQLSLGLDSLMLLMKNNSLISKTQSSSMKTALNDLSSTSSSSCESDKSLLPGRESVTSSISSEASSVKEPVAVPQLPPAVHSKQKTVVFLKDRQYYIVKQSHSSGLATLAVNSSVSQAIPIKSPNKPQALNTIDCAMNQTSKQARNINPILNTATIKIEPDLNISCGVKTFGKSILNMPYGSIISAAKPCYSLLKKQTKNIPLTTPPSLSPVVKTEPVEEVESGFLLKRRPEVSNKKMLGVNQTHSAMLVSKCFEYEEKVSQAVSMCKFPNQAMCVRWLLRYLPLVSRQVSDPDYKAVHPFCASSASNYFQWNVGKQRAAEWLRAKAVSRLLRRVGYTEETAWSTHAIMVWSRLHGYTPMAFNNEECTTNVESWSSSYCEPVRVMEWLDSSHNMDLGPDLEVDVIQVPSPNTTSLRDNSPESNQQLILNTMDVESGLESQLLFIRESARELGFRFKPDQISPGLMYSTAERLILEAVKSLADDILRRALSKAWERNSNRPPDAVGVADIGAALQDRVEFDLLTNAGLGCQSTNTG